MFSLQPKRALSTAERQRGLQWVLWDGVAAQTILTLTGGAFLVAYALQLGATNAQIGLLAAIPTLANVFQLLSIRLVEWFANRRKIIVITLFVSRTTLFVIALIPFLAVSYPVFLLIAATVVIQTFAAVSAGCWNSWMQDLIPSDRLGTYFSRRLRISQAVGAVLSLVIAFALDYIKQQYPSQEIMAYALLFLMGGFTGYISIFLLSQTPEPRPVRSYLQFRKLLQLPFRHAPFRNLIWYNGLWNFATNLAAPFFTVYLLRRLGYGVSTVIVLTVISQIATSLSLRLWGRYADRYSYKTILGICAPLYLVGLLGWTFTTLPDPHTFTLPLLILIHLTMGLATGGTSLAASSIGLKIAPKEQSVAYLSVISMTNALSAGAAPIIGGLLADFFTSQEFALSLTWRNETRNVVVQALNLQQLDFFFAFAFLLGLLALYRLGYVREEGDVEEKVLLQEIVLEIQREIKNLSSVTGARSLIKLPSSLFQTIQQYAKDRNSSPPTKQP
jgi:MFS family permease